MFLYWKSFLFISISVRRTRRRKLLLQSTQIPSWTFDWICSVSLKFTEFFFRFVQSGSWAFALADYQGKTADKHLSFVKGDLILVQKQKDSIWYSGQLNGKVDFNFHDSNRHELEFSLSDRLVSSKSCSTGHRSRNSNRNKSNRVRRCFSFYFENETFLLRKFKKTGRRFVDTSTGKRDSVDRWVRRCFFLIDLRLEN